MAKKCIRSTLIALGPKWATHGKFVLYLVAFISNTFSRSAKA